MLGYLRSIYSVVGVDDHTPYMRGASSQTKDARWNGGYRERRGTEVVEVWD